jgi:SAM-dependent methyltransferase
MQEVNPDAIANMEDYLNLIYPIFKVTKDATVLEVGPGPGWHTDMILSYQPKELICVEPDLDREVHLSDWFTTAKLVNADIFDYLNGDKKPADVVVACGVIYHFHNPFQFLELIVNKVNPKHLILESVIDEHSYNIATERVNDQAQRIIKGNYKTVNYCFVVGTKYIIQAMKDLGYLLVVKHNFDEKHNHKATLSMMHFERIDNE